MDRTEISRRVKEIEASRRDPEKAHILEDGLYADVLRDIAKNGDALSRSKAAVALRAARLDFPRWAA